MEKKKRYRILIHRLGIASLVLTVAFVIAAVISTVISAGELEIMLPEGCRAKDFYPESPVVKVQTDPDNEQRMIIEAVGR